VTAAQREKNAALRKHCRRLEALVGFVDTWCFGREIDARSHGHEDPDINRLRRRLQRVGYHQYQREK